MTTTKASTGTRIVETIKSKIGGWLFGQRSTSTTSQIRAGKQTASFKQTALGALEPTIDLTIKKADHNNTANKATLYEESGGKASVRSANLRNNIRTQSAMVLPKN